MHLRSYLSLTYLKCVWNTYISPNWHSHLKRTLFYDKVLNMLCNLLNAILKVEKQNGCEYTVYLLTAWLMGSCSSLPLPSIARGCITQNATSLGKDQDLK